MRAQQRRRSLRTIPLVLALAALAALELALPAGAATQPTVTINGGCYVTSTTPAPGLPVLCAVVASPPSGGPTPTGALFFSVPSYKGTVSPTDCVVPSNGYCEFHYSPTGTGTATRVDTITITYGGDPVYATTKTKLSVPVRPRPVVAIGGGCYVTSTTPAPGLPVLCAVVASPPSGGPTPTGALFFSVPSYKGTVSPTDCVVPSNGYCEFYYSPTGTGTATRKDTITITYGGDPVYATTTTKLSIPVRPRPVVAINGGCNQTSTTPGVAVQCLVVASPPSGGPTPAGAFYFTAPSYKGTVSPPNCTYLTNGCAFSYTPSGTGTATRKDTITITYGGDPVYATSKITFQISVRAP